MKEKKVYMRIPDDIHKKIKVYAACKGYSITEYITKLITEDLKENFTDEMLRGE